MSEAKGNRPSREMWWLAVILGASLLLRLALSPLPGYKVDQAAFLYWHAFALEHGVAGFYQPPNWTDYPPLNPYLFWLWSRAALPLGMVLLPWLPLEGETLAKAAIKVPANLFDLGIAALIFFALRRLTSPRLALATTAAYAFNPATLFNLAVWGQVDSIYSFFALASLLLFLGKRYELSAASLALAVLAKPQSAVVLPVLAYHMLRCRLWWRILTAVVAAAATVFLVVLPYAGLDPVRFLLRIYFQAYGVYPYTSVNAYNLWGGLHGFWRPDGGQFLGISFWGWGWLAYAAFALLVLYWLHRRPYREGMVFACFLLSFGFFLLLTRMHERYIFLSLPLLASALYLPRVLPLYIGLSLTYLGTMVYLLPVLNADRFVPRGDLSFYLFVPAYVLLFLYSLYLFFQMPRSKGEG